MKSSSLRLLIDAAGPEGGGSDASPWFLVAAHLAADHSVQVNWLNRGYGQPPSGVNSLPFPAHRRGACANDSWQLQQHFSHLSCDVFVSTGWTTPVGVASLVLVDELSLGGQSALTPRALAERSLAWLFAQRIVCATESVRSRLLTELPGIDAGRLVLAGLNWQSEAPAVWVRRLAAQLHGLLHDVQEEVRGGAWASCFAEWRRLRQLQAGVDV